MLKLSKVNKFDTNSDIPYENVTAEAGAKLIKKLVKPINEEYLEKVKKEKFQIINFHL